MDTIIHYICIPLGYLMKWCYQLIGNYGMAIILFTLATKIVLMPISIWIQKNSILMVKIQPEINFIKANLKGNIDAIADEQTKLFKREKYHPSASLIPLALQLILLLGVVFIINNPLTYLFNTSSETIDALAKFIKANTEDSSFQIQIVEAIKNGTITATSAINGVSAETLSSLVSKVSDFNTGFCGLNMSIIPIDVWKVYTLVPIIAGLSSFFMCWTQNLSNVIQHEQNKFNQYGIMGLSVALSLYLGLFVPTGIALYWTASNLSSIAVMYILNAAINPKKYVDYEALEASRKALEESKAFGALDKKSPLYKEMKKREKQDYKKFKGIANKHIVFYSEKSGFYKYYKDIINSLLKKSNVAIHYVTNDYNDQIFEIAKKEPRIKPYYISLKKTAVLMMLIETDIFVLTTPDINKYFLKRSFIKKDIEYIYVPHDAMSIHMAYTQDALNAYDTVFCSGPHVKRELQKIEEVDKLKQKTLVEFGFPFLDDLVKMKEEELKSEKTHKTKQILIAPTWNEDNIMDSCLDDIIENLYKHDDYHLIVRPHPEYTKRNAYKLQQIVEKYKDYDPKKLTFELDFSTNKSIYTSDVIITDWSGISVEFCLATKKPAVFINTKMKVQNQDWAKLEITPVEIEIRDKFGKAIEKEDAKNIDETIAELIKNNKTYKKEIEKYFETFIYNHGKSGECGAKYILQSLLEKKNKNKKEG